MATYQVTGPGGAVYHVQGPEGADPSEILAAMHGQSSAAGPSGGWLNDIALAGRDAAEGVVDTLAFPHDLSVALSNRVHPWMNRVFGTHYAPQHTVAGQFSRALTFLGAPVPTTPDQQLAASAIRGTTGALTSMGVLGLGGIANQVRAALSGASGGATADVARQAGAGPVGQFLAGIVGGLVPSAIEGVLPALNPRLSVNPLTRGFTRAGQTQMAANTLVREATDPAAAAASLSSAAPLVPGSLRTTGEASGDTGLLALEKGIRARSPGPFGERISQQNAARQAELAALGKTPADIAAAEALRENETAPMREAAFAGARGRRMTLYRGIRPGASDGYMNGGAIWTTPDRNVAAQYAADQLGPNDFGSAGARGMPGNVREYHVSLQRPYVLTQDNLPDFAKFFAPGEAESGGYIDSDSSMGDRPGLIGLSHTARQNLLDNGYDSVIVHAEAVRPEGEPPSVILLRSPEETAAAAQAADPQPAQSFPGRVPIKPLQDGIDQLLGTPAGARESIGKTLRWAKRLIGETDDPNATIDPETLYEIRKDLALAQRDQLQPGGRDAPNATMLAQARGQLGKVISSLDDAIESAAPGYKGYLSRYAELSEPIDQMQAIQGLQKRASSGLDTATGEQFLSGPLFARNLRSTLERSDGPFSPRLTPEQTQRLEAVREDLQRAGAVGNPTVRTPGSDTFQNFMTGQRTGSGLLPHFPFVGKFLSPLSKYIDARVNDQLADAMLNPQRAAQLLRQGVPPMPVGRTVATALGRTALPVTTGPLAALPRPTAIPAPILHPTPLTAWLESKLAPLTGVRPPPGSVPSFLAGFTHPFTPFASRVPAQLAQAGNSGVHAHQGLQELHGQRQHANMKAHIQRLLARTPRGLVRGTGGALHLQASPGRHVTVLPATFPGSMPQVLSGIVSMR